MKKLLITCLFALAVLVSAAQEKPLSARMAETVMTIWKDSFALGGGPVKWSYDMGVILKGFENIWSHTGDVTYFNYIQKQMDVFIQNDGTIRGYKKEEYNIDHINNGKLALLLFRVTGKDKYLKASRLLRSQLQTHPRTNEGGFWHKKIYPYQMWLDGLYMGAPFYAEYAMLSGEDSAFHDIVNQFVWMEKHARDPKTGLLYHGWDESRQMKWVNPQTGTSSLFWSRAMGWYASALVDVLDYFPADHPRRGELIAILNRLMAAVVKQQDPATGVWKDILAYNGPDKEKNYFEASASCQFVYALAKGARNGYLPLTYIVQARKGWEGIKKTFVKEENGQTNLHGTVKVSGLGGNPYRDGSFAYYMSEPVIVNDPKGMGAFLLAASEMEVVPTMADAYGKQVLMDDYFNSEKKKNAFGKEVSWHYKWQERDHGGFYMFGQIFRKHGYRLATLSKAPTAELLKNASVYVMVDPDTQKETPHPNFMDDASADVIYNWVSGGGRLLMMLNDSTNADFKHFNILSKKFGITFNENLRHDVINDRFEMAELPVEPGHPIFKTARKLFIKQLCTQTLQSPAVAVYGENGEVYMSVAQIGKGFVFAIGDPWLYNEYVDGRKLPARFDNYKAAEDLVRWFVKPIIPAVVK